MKSFVQGLLIVAVLLIAISTTRGEYYYGSEGQVSLRVDSFKIAVKFDTTIPQLQVFAAHSRLQNVLPDNNMVNGFFAVSVGAGGDIYVFLDSLNNSTGILAAEPYYYLLDSIPAPVGNEFVVGFEDYLDSSEIVTIAANFNR